MQITSGNAFNALAPLARPSPLGFAALAEPPVGTWAKDPETGEETVHVPEIAGPFAWAQAHAWAQNVHDWICPVCGAWAIAAINGLHDVVNRKLGKPLQHRGDVEQLYWEIKAAYDSLDRSGERTGEMAPLPDPWGSRCRDPLGHWTFPDNCPSFPEDLIPVGRPETFAIGPSGLTRYELRHAIADGAELIVSNDPFTFTVNPAFPSDLQPRMRTRAANRAQVEMMAANLAPDALLVDFHSIDRGSPIVGADNVVESGNGRVMALLRAAKEHPASFDRYRQALAAIAPQYGLGLAAVEGLGVPVLVRLRLTEVVRRAFVEEANGRATLSASAVEQARGDAQRITLDMLAALDVGENEAVAEAVKAARNAAFVQRFAAMLPPQEQAQLIDSKGNLSTDGVRRAVMAIFVRAFSGDAGLMLAERAFESVDEDVKTAINGIARALGPLVQAEALIEAGQRDLSLSISADIAAAVNVLAKIKVTPSLNVAKYLSQGQLIERELSPFQERVLASLDEHKRSARRIGLILRAYAQAVIDVPPSSQTSMFPTAPPTKETLWARALGAAAYVPASEPLLAQRDPMQQVDWCDIAPEARAALWQWRALREAVLEGIGAGGQVSACPTGLLGDAFQITIEHPQAAVRERLRKSFLLRLQRRAYEVLEFGTKRLIFEVTVPPSSAQDLTWWPQEIIRERRPPEGEQPRLLQVQNENTVTAIEIDDLLASAPALRHLVIA